MRFLFFIVFFLTIIRLSDAQDSVSLPIDTTSYISPYDATETTARPDSIDIEARNFAQDKIEKFQNDSDFDYKQPPTVAESLWDRFLSWIDQLFGWIFRSASNTNWGRVIVYALGIALVVIIIMLLLKVDALKVFYSGADKGTLKYDTFHENIHEMNFDRLIQEAVEKREYRLCIRLTFLYALKLLSDKQLVDWRPGKTNHEYLQELKNQDLKIGFNELSFYFDYAWYGDFNVNDKVYDRVRMIFETWKTKV